MPFLEGSLKTLGLLNYHPVAEIMAHPVVVINELSRVSSVYEVLKATNHNGFPVLNKDGHLRGLILRKTLCSLLKYKAFSFPTVVGLPGGGVTSASTVFHDTIERNYPHYPTINEIQLSPAELVSLRHSSFSPLYLSFAVYRMHGWTFDLTWTLRRTLSTRVLVFNAATGAHVRHMSFFITPACYTNSRLTD